jgi:enoyl-[acyl-carrier protein] reductase I
MNTPPDRALEGRKGLVVGIANAHSIAFGCALAFRRLGAELAVTDLNDKARPHVEPLAQELQAPIFLPCGVQDDAQVDALSAALRECWGRLDFALHAVAFAAKPDLQGWLTDPSREGFLTAMDISCHSFIRPSRSPVLPAAQRSSSARLAREVVNRTLEWGHQGLP